METIPSQIQSLKIYFWGGYENMPRLPYQRGQVIDPAELYSTIGIIVDAGYNVMIRKINPEDKDWAILVDTGIFYRSC